MDAHIVNTYTKRAEELLHYILLKLKPLTRSNENC